MTSQYENENTRPADADKMQDLRLWWLEEAVNKIGYDARAARKKRFTSKNRAIVLYGMSRALCVETIDPWKQYRVRFFHPILHDPSTPFLKLPFAAPVSSMGGIDDCGLAWVPPAGSTLIVFFEHGNSDAAFYLGTTWHRNRGHEEFPVAFREWGIYRGHRGGYFHGPTGDPNDESQVMPQWNTENYNSRDINDVHQFLDSPSEHNKVTFPNIYGIKTPEKHMIKLVDGDAKCNRRNKRMELLSGCGNWMMFKDDHLHYGGQWAHPSCPPDPGGENIETCAQSADYYTDIIGQPIENVTCESTSSACGGSQGQSGVMGGHSSTPGYPPNPTTQYYKSQGGANPNFKHMNECRPYRGPGTPQNNKCALPQSGIQLLSISGHSLVMDDSVLDPQGQPRWERSMEDFDFGCSDQYQGLFYAKSATGHQIVMSDIEPSPKLRGDQNVIELRTATGNLVQLNDHTVKKNPCSTNCQECPPDYAGENRGIHLISTSNHKIKMIDHMNEQCSPCRAEGGTPISKATKAYILIQSGYGLEMRYNDDFSQQQTQSQWIQILHPQCVDPMTDDQCNSCPEAECRGPHILRFQGRPKGTPGVVYLRAGGHAIRQTYDMDIVIVGDKEKNPSDKYTYVSKKRISATEDVDYRYSGELHIFFAEKKILLLAGRDCPPKEGQKCKQPCVYPVIIARCPVTCPVTGITHWTEKAISERVFASGHHPCQDPPNCGGDCETYDETMADAAGKGCKESDSEAAQGAAEAEGAMSQIY